MQDYSDLILKNLADQGFVILNLIDIRFYVKMFRVNVHRPMTMLRIF